MLVVVVESRDLDAGSRCALGDEVREHQYDGPCVEIAVQLTCARS